MDITIGRLKHMLRVAEKMKQAVESNPNICDASADEVFLLGYLHDVGYSLVDRQEDHAQAGGKLLITQGYKFWKEVFYHGVPECEYKSSELSILNWADMTVNQSGKDVSILERLEDIKKRYGENSVQYSKAVQLSKEIQYWVKSMEVKE